MFISKSIRINFNSGLIFGIFSLFLLFTSCDQNRFYEKNITVEKYNWSSGFIPSYTVEIKDTSTLYDIFINVRHADWYPWQNIWLTVGTQFPDGHMEQQRIEVMLAEESGKWYGEGIGDIWDYRTQIQEHAAFPQPGTYIFTLEQNMRQDPLPGIMSVGIRVENTSLNRNSRSTNQ